MISQEDLVREQPQPWWVWNINKELYLDEKKADIVYVELNGRLIEKKKEE